MEVRHESDRVRQELYPLRRIYKIKYDRAKSCTISWCNMDLVSMSWTNSKAAICYYPQVISDFVFAFTLVFVARDMNHEEANGTNGHRAGGTEIRQKCDTVVKSRAVPHRTDSTRTLRATPWMSISAH